MSQSQGKHDGESWALVEVEPTTAVRGELVVVDDSPLWVAWEAAIQAWLDAKRRKSGSDNTVETYRTALRQFETWARERLGRPELLVWPVVSSAMAQEWAAHLEREGLAPATVNVKLSALSSFYEFVRRRYIIPTPDGQGKSLWPADRANPFDAVERTKITPFANATFLMPAEMAQVLAAIDTRNLTGKRDFALLYAYMQTCRRFSELINLRWGDLQALGDGNFAFSYRAKGGEIRKAVLDRKVYAVICEYLKADGRPPEEMKEDDYVFVAMDPYRITRLPQYKNRPIDPNQPISNHMANRILKKRAKRAGIANLEGAHIHGLRHGGLRLRREEMEANGGVDYEELKELAGHASIEMTFGYSRKVLEDPQDPTGEAAAERLLPKGRRRRRRKGPPGEQLAMGLDDV